jgi:hypothetical protein
LLLSKYRVPPAVFTSDPKVPPQHEVTCPLTLKSLLLLPDVPNSTGVVCAVWFPGTIVTIALPERLASTCDTAVTVSVFVEPAAAGTPPGAT